MMMVVAVMAGDLHLFPSYGKHAIGVKNCFSASSQFLVHSSKMAQIVLRNCELRTLNCIHYTGSGFRPEKNLRWCQYG
jgi:hypothetical protein